MTTNSTDISEPKVGKKEISGESLAENPVRQAVHKSLTKIFTSFWTEDNEIKKHLEPKELATRVERALFEFLAVKNEVRAQACGTEYKGLISLPLFPSFAVQQYLSSMYRQISLS
jgi:hypothetical protein